MHTIGPHTSIAGGVQHAVIQAFDLGANAFGMFTKNQRQWKSKDLEKEAIELFKSTMAEKGFTAQQVLVHDSYLINLGNPDPEKRKKSLDAFIDELRRVEQLGLSFLTSIQDPTWDSLIPRRVSLLLLRASILPSRKLTMQLL